SVRDRSLQRGAIQRPAVFGVGDGHPHSWTWSIAIHETTVLGGVKGARAALGGCAVLDPAGAPWMQKMRAMDVRGPAAGAPDPGVQESPMHHSALPRHTVFS